MIIDAISDLHGELPELSGGDLLIIAGDITGSDKVIQWKNFFDWLKHQQYRKKILIGGNHDGFLADCATTAHAREIVGWEDEGFEYLCDNGTEFEGLKIWGMPWSLWFDGINPHCKAFTCSEKEMRKHLVKIPRDIDILISHGPPHGILDSVKDVDCDCEFDCYKPTGSISLRDMLLDGSYFPNLKAIIFGHIHEHGGKKLETTLTTFYNVSIMDENYDPVHKPTRITFKLMKNL